MNEPIAAVVLPRWVRVLAFLRVPFAVRRLSAARAAQVRIAVAILCDACKDLVRPHHLGDRDGKWSNVLTGELHGAVEKKETK